MNRRIKLPRRVLFVLCGLCAAGPLFTDFIGNANVVAATSCESLTTLTLPNARIDSAQMVAAGAFVQPSRGGGAGGGGARGAGRGTAPNPFASLPAFCRVTATLTPTNDSDIKAEIWLPA